MKIKELAFLAVLGNSMSVPALAVDDQGWGEWAEESLDRRGDRIDARLDRRGDR